MTHRLLLVLYLLVTISFFVVCAKVYETDDAIIIEGECEFHFFRCSFLLFPLILTCVCECADQWN